MSNVHRLPIHVHDQIQAEALGLLTEYSDEETKEICTAMAKLVACVPDPSPGNNDGKRIIHFGVDISCLAAQGLIALMVYGRTSLVLLGKQLEHDPLA